MTSIKRSHNCNLLLAGSFCMLTRPRNASSSTIQPRRAYEILSFHGDRYPYTNPSALKPPVLEYSLLTCLSFNPRSNTSSIKVNFGCLLRSWLSLISRGSYAILCPSSLVYETSLHIAIKQAHPSSAPKISLKYSFPRDNYPPCVEGPAGEPALAPPFSSAATPAPRRRVRPDEAIPQVDFGF